MSVIADLKKIEALQPEIVEKIRARGFVFDEIGDVAPGDSELVRWKKLAFTLYSDLTHAGVLAKQSMELLGVER